MLKTSLIAALEKIVGKENLLASREALRVYSYDATTNWEHEPDVVVFPSSANEISLSLKLANREKIPVTPRGGGTNASGGSIPINGGILLCTTKMNKILKIDKENLCAVVEPGLILQDLTLRLARDGLFFPPDPQSFLGATLGGILAENGGGPACLKYGVTKQYVLGIEVVLPTGEIVSLGGRTLNVVGYDLLRIIVGSEGTLGVITKAELKLRRVPSARKTMMAVYADVAVAGENVSRILENGVVPYKIELLDNWVINRIEEISPMGLPKDADAVLLFEVDGETEAVEKEMEKIVEITQHYGATDVRVAKDQAEADAYWMARRAGFAAAHSRMPTQFSEDVAVPRGNMPALIKKVKEICEKYNVENCILGHTGDGNLHPAVLTDVKDKEHYGRAMKAVDEIIEAVVELNGVISGEHGIGLEKKKYFNSVTDPVVVNMMKGVKTLFDPNNIMNPGKIWN